LISVLLVMGVVAVLVCLALVAVRVRRRGSAGPAIGAAMAAYDEAMHATAYETFTQFQAQRDRGVETPGTAPRIRSAQGRARYRSASNR